MVTEGIGKQGESHSQTDVLSILAMRNIFSFATHAQIPPLLFSKYGNCNLIFNLLEEKGGGSH